MNLLQRSVCGAVMILIIIALRAILLNKLPKRTFVILWCVVIWRLLVPFSFSSAFSIYSLTGLDVVWRMWEQEYDSSTGNGFDAGNGYSAGNDDQGEAGGPGNGYFGEAGYGSGSNYQDEAENGFGNGYNRDNADDMGYDYDMKGAYGAGEGSRTRGEASSNVSWAGFAERLVICRNIGTKNLRIFIPDVIWGIGALLCAGFYMTAYLRYMREFRTNLPVEESLVNKWLGRQRRGRHICVRKSDRISMPLTYGILKPVILLPEKVLEGLEDCERTDSERTDSERTDSEETNFAETNSALDLEYILQHEYVHICHQDVLLKLVMTVTLCIHWFNPFAWIMSGLFARDIELSCDEGVLRRFGTGARSKYALVLIGMEERRCEPAYLYSSFGRNAGGRSMEERIGSIMRYKKSTFLTLVTALLLVVCMAVVFATTGQESEAAQKRTGLDNQMGEVENRDVNTGGDILTDPPVRGSVLDNMIMAPEGSSVSDTDQPISGIGIGNPSGNENGAALALDDGTMDEDDNVYMLRYMMEGMPEEEEADLYVGTGYCILVPSGKWRRYAPDAWLSESNESVQFWVTDFGAWTGEEAAENLAEEGYVFEDNNNTRMRKTDGDLVRCVDLCRQITMSGVENIWGIYYTFPQEAEEGFGRRLRAISESFRFLPAKEGEGLSEDGKVAARLVTVFWQAYLSGNENNLKQYLAKDYSGDVEGFPDGSEGYNAEEARVHAVKGLDVEDKNIGEGCVVSVEFWPSADRDSMVYLTVELVKEQEGWKVSGYGLEG